MMTKATILAAILSLPQAYYPPGKAPETREQYVERMALVAEAIMTASADAVCASEDDGCVRVWPGGQAELAAALVTIAHHESMFLLRVHEGRCLAGECDALVSGGKLVHRAKSLWQVHTSKLVPLEEWRLLGGVTLEATTKAAAAASRVLSASRTRCGGPDWVAGAFSSYATGHSCAWQGSLPRVRTYRKVYARVVSSR